MGPIPLIAFGPNSNIYFIGIGMRYYAVGMPDSVFSTANKWAAVQIKWMSIDTDGAWIAQDSWTNNLEFDTRIPSHIIEKCRGPQGFKFLTFGPMSSIGGTWAAVGPDNSGVWSGCLTEEYLSHLRELQVQVGSVFNTALRGILLGKGSTMVFMFAGGFSYYTDREAEGGKLERASGAYLMNEYLHRQPAWTIERGSVLCPWNIDYFFLKFKDPQSAQIKMHWNLPPHMDAQFHELWAAAESPEGAAAIAKHEQLGMAVAMSNSNLAIATGDALKISTGYYTYGRRW